MERPAIRTTSEKVYLATKAALKRADELGAESIAFSGMGTGVGGLSFEEAAKAMMKAMKEFDLISNSLKKIILCDLNPNMTGAWKSVLEAKN
jgi:O-acetyl-ADP-ribose deacetylase (regulator of RNase III)